MQLLKIILIFFVVLLVACSKNEEKEPVASGVIVVGYEENSKGVEVAKYWRNGMPIFLSDSNSAVNNEASSIAVKGSEIYIAGSGWKNNYRELKYWKNGKEVILSISNSFFINTKIVVNGNDFYIADCEGHDDGKLIGKLYKNGIGTIISDTAISTIISSLKIENDNIYIAGILQDSVPPTINYWKNGIANPLPERNFDRSKSGPFNTGFPVMDVKGNDIYIAISDYNKFDGVNQARYWKNGVEVEVTDASHEAYISSIAVNNNDVYLAGYEINDDGIRAAKYWKNNIPYNLTDGTNNSSVASIKLLDDDVYVCGYEENKEKIRIAKYWKNGIAYILSNGKRHAMANDIILFNGGVKN